MIILEVTKSRDSTLSLEDTFLEKPQGRWIKFNTPPPPPSHPAFLGLRKR